MRIKDWRFAFAFLLVCGVLESCFGQQTATIIPVTDATTQKDLMNLAQTIQNPIMTNAQISTESVTNSSITNLSISNAIYSTNGSLSSPSYSFSSDKGTGIYRNVQPTWAISSSNWNTTTYTISQTAHGLYMTAGVTLTTTGSLPSGLSTGTTYYVIWVDANDFALASTAANAANYVSVSFSTQGSGTHTVTPITTHDLAIDVDGNWSVIVTSGTNYGTNPSAGGQVYIGGRTLATQPSELLHMEGSGDITQDTSADGIILNPSGHSSRWIVSSTGTIGSAAYLADFGSLDSSTMWSGGPTYKNTPAIILQGGPQSVIYTETNPYTYFYDDQSSPEWDFVYGANNYALSITASSVIFDNQVSLSQYTKSQISSLVPYNSKGSLISCSNCSSCYVCQSTGTTAGSWSCITGLSTACN